MLLMLVAYLGAAAYNRKWNIDFSRVNQKKNTFTPIRDILHFIIHAADRNIGRSCYFQKFTRLCAYSSIALYCAFNCALRITWKIHIHYYYIFIWLQTNWSEEKKTIDVFDRQLPKRINLQWAQWSFHSKVKRIYSHSPESKFCNLHAINMYWYDLNCEMECSWEPIKIYVLHILQQSIQYSALLDTTKSDIRLRCAWAAPVESSIFNILFSKNHFLWIFPEASINESCYFNEQCEAYNFQTECRDGRCICRYEMTAVQTREGNYECKGMLK